MTNGAYIIAMPTKWSIHKSPKDQCPGYFQIDGGVKFEDGYLAQESTEAPASLTFFVLCSSAMSIFTKSIVISYKANG